MDNFNQMSILVVLSMLPFSHKRHKEEHKSTKHIADRESLDVLSEIPSLMLWALCVLLCAFCG